MFGAILKSGYKYFSTGWKSYCTVKVAEQTGMPLPELMLYKETVEDCGQYYLRKLSLFLKEHAQKSRAKRLKLQPQLAVQNVPNQKLMEIG